MVCFLNTCTYMHPLDCDLSGRWRYPAFEQPGPGLQIKLSGFNPPEPLGLHKLQTEASVFVLSFAC